MSTITEVKAAVTATNGKFFSVKFIKKDGSVREMTARTGVKKHLAGGVSTIAHKDNLVSVYDMNNGYRCFDAERVIEIKMGGNVLFHSDELDV